MTYDYIFIRIVCRLGMFTATPCRVENWLPAPKKAQSQTHEIRKTNEVTHIQIHYSDQINVTAKLAFLSAVCQQFQRHIDDLCNIYDFMFISGEKKTSACISAHIEANTHRYCFNFLFSIDLLFKFAKPWERREYWLETPLIIHLLKW